MNKVILLLFFTVFIDSAYAASIDLLIKRYGKEAIVQTIRAETHGSVTIDVRGDLITGYGPPNKDHVNARSIQADLDKLGYSIAKFELLLKNNQKQKRQTAAKQAGTTRKAAYRREAMLPKHLRFKRTAAQPPNNYKTTIQVHLENYLRNPGSVRDLSISKPKKLTLESPVLDFHAGEVVFLSTVSYIVKDASGDYVKKHFLYAFRGEKLIRVKEVQ